MEFLRLLEGLRTPFFNAIFSAVTLLGEETLFMVAAMIVFWCVNKRTGYYLLYISFFGALANALLKVIFCIARPWVRDPEFTIVESARSAATGYSFPSGHTQSAGGLYLGVGRAVNRAWVWIVCIAVTLLVGFSRMYLGVHSPADVLVSLGLSALMVFVLWPLFRRGFEKPGVLVGLVAFLIGFGLAVLLHAELAPLPAQAVAEYSAASVKTVYSMLGASVGFALVLLLDTKWIRFSEKAVWWAQILKVVLGLGIVVALRMLLKAPLLALTGGHNIANAIRYFLMVLIGGAVWPLSFRWFSQLGKKRAAPVESK